MKLLITGSAGFLGSHAVKAAMARGWGVDSFDIRAHPPRKMDVRMLSGIECDCVLHLAGFSSNAGFAGCMADAFAANVFGTWNVLRLAHQTGARVVYASSSAVYGNQWTVVNGGEKCNSELQSLDTAALVSHYGKSKLMGEMMAESFRSIGLSALGVRIFNAYGPGDELKGDRCAPMEHFTRSKLAGEPMVIYGDGEQAKDFIHVSDVTEILMRLCDSDAGGIVNVGTGVATSFNRLAELIGGDVDYLPIPNPESYQYFTRADTTRLLSIVGPYEFMSVEEGLGKL